MCCWCCRKLSSFGRLKIPNLGCDGEENTDNFFFLFFSFLFFPKLKTMQLSRQLSHFREFNECSVLTYLIESNRVSLLQKFQVSLNARSCCFSAAQGH